MNNYLTLKNNKIVNKTLGKPTISDGETIIEATGSYGEILVGSYYISDSNTFYYPSIYNFQLSGSEKNDNNLNSATSSITIEYNRDVTFLSNNILSSEELDISNFSVSGNALSADILLKEDISDWFEEGNIVINIDQTQVNDEHGNLPLINNKNNIIKLYYSSSIPIEP